MILLLAIYFFRLIEEHDKGPEVEKPCYVGELSIEGFSLHAVVEAASVLLNVHSDLIGGVTN
jgi:hypothetical protein